MAAHNRDWHVVLVDLSDDALALARENVAFQGVGERVEVLKSDLFAAVRGRRYDLIVSNPPYVTEDEYAALPGEYAHEPKLGLTAGADGLDICLRILDEAADLLSDDGLLIVEVGESERALAALLPEVPFVWVEFKVGQMGVFVLEKRDLVDHHAAIHAAAARR
jgi:ribosomal protein L3 glutamine methyltransferase